MNHIIIKNINPRRDWKITIIIFGVGLALLSVFSWKIYLSDRIGGGYLSNDDVSSTVTVKTIDAKKLKASILLLQKTKSASIKLVDPSR